MNKLNLTAKEVLDKHFDKDFKGYSSDQVDDFLDVVIEDYQLMEENVSELLNMINSLQAEVKSLQDRNVELEGMRKAFDLSKTTSYSSVDLLKRISRIEEEVFKK